MLNGTNEQRDFTDNVVHRQAFIALCINIYVFVIVFFNVY